MASDGEVVLITGSSGLIGRRLSRALAARLNPARDRLVFLARPTSVDAALASLAALPVPGEVLSGDVAHMHLGLSREELKSLAREVTSIWHLASEQDLALEARRLRAVNLEGTRNVLELAARAPRLARLNHFSTAYVSGDRAGVVLEEELERGQRFGDAYSRTKFEAERLVRAAMPELPVTVYRPATVVGDPALGESARFDGPYAGVLLLAASPVPLPLPGSGVAPLHVVPVEWVVDAALALAANPSAIGATVHLVDPAPLSVRQLQKLVADRDGKSLPQVSLPRRAVETLLGLPGLERLARPQRSAVHLVNHLALYNCRQLLTLLGPGGPRCPPVTSYLDRLVAFTRQRLALAARDEPTEGEDPLDEAP